MLGLFKKKSSVLPTEDDEIVKTLKKAKQKKTTTVKLENLVIPAALVVEAFTTVLNVETLAFFGTRLVAVPAEIVQLSSLRHLDLNDNRLTVLPAEFARLNLVSLNLSKNHFTTIPLEVVSINTLQVLDVSFNEIVSVPVGLYALPAIKTINLRGNHLKTLPTGIEVAPTLKTLTLADNPWDIASAKIVGDGMEAVKSYMKQSGPRSSGTHAQIAHQAQAFQKAHRQSSTPSMLEKKPASEAEEEFLIWLQIQGFEKSAVPLQKHNLLGFEPLLKANVHDLVDLGIMDKTAAVRFFRAIEEFRRRFKDPPEVDEQTGTIDKFFVEFDEADADETAKKTLERGKKKKMSVTTTKNRDSIGPSSPRVSVAMLKQTGNSSDDVFQTQDKTSSKLEVKIAPVKDLEPRPSTPKVEDRPSTPKVEEKPLAPKVAEVPLPEPTKEEPQSPVMLKHVEETAVEPGPKDDEPSPFKRPSEIRLQEKNKEPQAASPVVEKPKPVSKWSKPSEKEEEEEKKVPEKQPAAPVESPAKKPEPVVKEERRGSAFKPVEPKPAAEQKPTPVPPVKLTAVKPAAAKPAEEQTPAEEVADDDDDVASLVTRQPNIVIKEVVQPQTKTVSLPSSGDSGFALSAPTTFEVLSSPTKDRVKKPSGSRRPPTRNATPTKRPAASTAASISKGTAPASAFSSSPASSSSATTTAAVAAAAANTSPSSSPSFIRKASQPETPPSKPVPAPKQIGFRPSTPTTPDRPSTPTADRPASVAGSSPAPAPGVLPKPSFVSKDDSHLRPVSLLAKRNSLSFSSPQKRESIDAGKFIPPIVTERTSTDSSRSSFEKTPDTQSPFGLKAKAGGKPEDPSILSTSPAKDPLALRKSLGGAAVGSSPLSGTPPSAGYSSSPPTGPSPSSTPPHAVMVAAPFKATPLSASPMRSPVQKTPVLKDIGKGGSLDSLVPSSPKASATSDAAKRTMTPPPANSPSPKPSTATATTPGTPATPPVESKAPWQQDLAKKKQQVAEEEERKRKQAAEEEEKKAMAQLPLWKQQILQREKQEKK